MPLFLLVPRTQTHTVIIIRPGPDMFHIASRLVSGMTSKVQHRPASKRVYGPQAYSQEAPFHKHQEQVLYSSADIGNPSLQILDILWHQDFLFEKLTIFFHPDKFPGQGCLRLYVHQVFA